MAQTQLLGGGTVQPGVALAVDPLYQAARIALRPLDHTNLGQVLGHYAVAQGSGAVLSLAAGTTINTGAVGSMRWSDLTRFLVLMRLKAGWEVTAQVTAATPMDLMAKIVRSFITDFTVGTAANLASATRTGQMRASMSGSLMGQNGPRIATTLTMSGAAGILDNDAFAMTCWPSQVSPVVGATANALLPVGVAGAMQTLYEYTSPAQHPVVLSQNEGVVLQAITAGNATGAVKYLTQWEWAEVAVY